MCGISGFFCLSDRSLRSDAAEVAADQVRVIRYRGPDAAGTWLGAGVALGHARLSIIDVSDAAIQPFFDNSGTIALAYNGEVYNFQELRAELEKLGHTFRTNSDTEVIIEGYAAWGDAVVDRLRGMFAFALFDSKQDRLLLVRDRIGKKPLYHAMIDGHLVFGSELKTILAFPGAKREPNLDAIHEYLTFQYVPSPMTAFEGIEKLPPAHMLVAERGKLVKISRYYSLREPGGQHERPMKELTGELVKHLREATRLRMISDVPLGAFLSGGVDSSAVVAMMAQEASNPVRTFTIGFEEQAYDERVYAQAVAKRYGTEHTEHTVRPNAMEILPELVYHYGEPYADSSAIPTYYVSKIAREHVTVILSGDGGDESFLGYTRYLWCRGADVSSKVPPVLGKPLQKLLLALPKGLDRNRYARRFRGLASRLYDRRSHRYEQVISYFSDAAKNEIYAGDFRDKLSTSSLDRLDQYFDKAQTMVEGAAYADIHTYLPDDLMVKVDVASMANSLEVRAPFLDHKLMDWAATIPEHQRFAGTEPKSLLKKAMEPYLPHDLMYRPKMGFGVPIDKWLRGEMKDFAYETLLSPAARARGLFNMDVVKETLDRHVAGEGHAPRLWALLMLEMWFQIWIDPVDVFELPTVRRIIDRFPGQPIAMKTPAEMSMQ